jgi:glucose dehydrogenase
MSQPLIDRRPTFVVTRNDRVQYVLLWLIRISLIIAAVWSGALGDLENLAMSLIALLCTFLPVFFERRYKLALPIEFHLVLVVFIYCTLFLGEVGNAYRRFWWWDMMLHASSGIVVGFVGFLMLYIPYVQKKLQMPNRLIAFFSFCMGLAAGAIWEIYEFTSDLLLHTSMQHGNGDTMHDLVTDAVGALLISMAGYQYLRHHQKGIIERLINGFVDSNPQLFRRK